MSNISFNKFYRKFNILSLVLIVISLVFLIFKGLNYGVDFKGGPLIELRSNTIIEVSSRGLSKTRLYPNFFTRLAVTP